MTIIWMKNTATHKLLDSLRAVGYNINCYEKSLMLMYINNKTLEVMRVIRKEVQNNMIIYHYLHVNGTIATLNQTQVTTVRYF